MKNNIIKHVYKVMKKQSIHLMVMTWLLTLPIFFLPGYSSAGDLSFISYDNQEMISFDIFFKQYITSFKGKCMEKEKGLKSIAAAIRKLNDMIAKAKSQSAETSVLGRLGVINGLLLQAQGLALQGRLSESLEVSVPIRSEIYNLHKELNMLTAEDHMIFFHNGVMHRAEPLIAKGRYIELAMLVPLIEDTLAKFKNPPQSATNTEQYKKKYSILVKKVKVYTAAISEVNNYVDQEYGAFMLNEMLMGTHADVHKKFSDIYLSFPEGMIQSTR